MLVGRHGLAIDRSTVGRALSVDAVGAALKWALYADVASSITQAGGVVSAWGAASALAGQVLYVPDTVAGGYAVRFDAASKLAIPAGTADHLSQKASTLVLVARARNTGNDTGFLPLLDSSSAGATRGFQLRVIENGTSNPSIRRLQARVSDGVTPWLVAAKPDSDQQTNTYGPLRWVVIVLQVGPSRVAMWVDGDLAFDVAQSTALPSGAPGALVIGGVRWDVKMLGGAPQMSDADALTIGRQVAARFGVPLTRQVAGKNPASPKYYAYAAGCVLADGSQLATYCIFDSGLNQYVGDVVALKSTDGFNTWTMLPQLPRIAGSSLTGWTPQTLANGHVAAVVTAAPTGQEQQWVYFSKSTDGGQTWSAPVQVVAAGETFTLNAAPVVEAAGKLYLPYYAATAADPTHWSVKLAVSTDEGATWPTRITVIDGPSTGHQWGELGIVIGKVGGAPSGLAVGTWLGLVRENQQNRMYEVTSTDGGATWSAPTLAIVANSTGGSIVQDPDTGEILWMGRNLAYQLSGGIWRRLGAASWSPMPNVIGTDAAYFSFLYGAFFRTAPQTYSIMLGREQTSSIADVIARRQIHLWELTGKMPGSATPTTVTLAAGATQQITAQGAGGWTYPGSFPSGGSVSASGLYTAGATAAADTIHVTDLNGAVVQDLTYTSTGAPTWAPPVPAAYWLDFSDPTNVTLAPSSTTPTAVRDLSANHVAVTCSGALVYDASLSGPKINGRPVLHQAGAGYVDATVAATLTDWTRFVVVRLNTGASAAGYHAIWSFANYTPALYYKGGVVDLYWNGSDYAFADLTDADGDVVVLTVQYVASTKAISVWRNGVASSANPKTLLAGGASTSAAVELLSEIVGGSSSAGPFDVAEELLFDSALSAANRANVETHLLAKWGHSP